MSRVFLSYARDDADTARRLAESISGAGHDVWWDTNLHGGSRFAREIDQALKDAAAVVVLWSKTSVESAWVQDEAAEGRDSGRLVPLAIDSVKPPLGFRQFHTIDIGPGHEAPAAKALGQVLDAIDRLCGSDPRGDEAAAPKTDRGGEAQAAVCVLPFVNMSGEPEQEYFSDGITEDITTDLSKVSALEVVARNTAFMFKGQTVDVKDVASTLGVTHVLEGSVRKAGGRVRINAQLIDGATGKHLWADRFDRDLTDIFEIQDEISKAIVGALKVKLLPQEKSAIESRGTSSVEAYNLYLMARRHWIEGTFGDIRRDETIARICRQAVAVDPDYAHAWALMALAQSELRFWHGKDVNALPAAERALELNPDIPEARCVKARYLEEDGKQEEANAEIEQALKLDPESWEVNREAARMLFRQGRMRESIPYFEKAASLMDSDFHNSSMLVTCYTALGDRQNLERVARMTLERSERALARDPTNIAAISAGAAPLALFGQDQRAREWIERGLLIDPDNLSMRYNLACTLVMALDDNESAIQMMAPYFEKVGSQTMLKHFEADPDFDSVRGDPRIKDMLAAAKRRLGLETESTPQAR